jgi:O-antigen/teichoic acid export membrane protein
MIIKNNKLISNGLILSLPGILSIFISLTSIPIHLNIAGVENYGNYLIFHFLLTISLILNLGIGKSIVISMNNFPTKSKAITYQGLRYTLIISLFILIIFIGLSFIKEEILFDFFKINSIFKYFTICTISTIFYISLESVFQGNEKFKSLSFYNFIFFSLSISLPSLTLLYDNNLTLDQLLLVSTVLKIFTILTMILIIISNNLILKSNNKILLNNLKKNSKWLTLNAILIQFYDLFDKYLIKIFMGPIALATYSIPQQLTGKLSIFSKGFSAFLLPLLSKKKITNNDFNLTIKIFLKLIPILIFLLFPFYSILLKFWLGENFNENILVLSKIFSLSVIFSCTSHILITKFEASQTLKRNLKFELLVMPFFLLALYFFTNDGYSLIYIASIILAKETILLFLRLNILQKEVKELYSYYIYSILFICMLYLFLNYQNLFELLILMKND